jgi:hypothetical protein
LWKDNETKPEAGALFNNFECERNGIFHTTLWVLDELKTSSNFPQKLGTLDDLEIPSKLCFLLKATLTLPFPSFAVPDAR